MDYELYPPNSAHPRPFQRTFYQSLTKQLRLAEFRFTRTLAETGALCVEMAAGELLTIELAEGAQIVNLFAFNSQDPDERIWTQDMCLIEGIYLTLFNRLWGTMARYRPLLTFIEDTVAARTGESRHHFLFGGFETPADWRLQGGKQGVKSTWEQFSDALESRSLEPSLLDKGHISLFQRMEVDGPSQQFLIHPSDARRGDRVTLFAEIDLNVLLVLSPYIDGSRPPAEISEPRPRAVKIAVSHPVAIALGWPYPGVLYPDLSLYENSHGRRSNKPLPTPGRES